MKCACITLAVASKWLGKMVVHLARVCFRMKFVHLSTAELSSKIQKVVDNW